MNEYTEITEGSKAIMRDMGSSSSVDQCKGCNLRGDLKACKAIECSNHDSWYVQKLKAQIEEFRSENECLKDRLKFIYDWNIPKVKNEDGRLTSYSVMYGSNGERDFMRNIAAKGIGEL